MIAKFEETIWAGIVSQSHLPTATAKFGSFSAFGAKSSVTEMRMSLFLNLPANVKPVGVPHSAAVMQSAVDSHPDAGHILLSFLIITLVRCRPTCFSLLPLRHLLLRSLRQSKCRQLLRLFNCLEIASRSQILAKISAQRLNRKLCLCERVAGYRSSNFSAIDNTPRLIKITFAS